MPLVVVAQEQRDLALLLHRHQPHHGRSQILLARGEQLVLGEALEDRDDRFVVVRSGEQVLLLHDRLELAPNQRDVPGGLGVRFAGEEPDHPQLADDRAVRADPLDPDVIHPHTAVHRRLAVGLGDDQQRAAEHPLAQVGRQLADPLGHRERRARLVGQDAQPRVGDDRDQRVVIVAVDRVLAVAEEDEVVVRQPLQEGHGLGDLVPRVAGGRHLGELDHPAHAVGHRVEVPHGQRARRRSRESRRTSAARAPLRASGGRPRSASPTRGAAPRVPARPQPAGRCRRARRRSRGASRCGRRARGGAAPRSRCRSGTACHRRSPRARCRGSSSRRGLRRG